MDCKVYLNESFRNLYYRRISKRLLFFLVYLIDSKLHYFVARSGVFVRSSNTSNTVQRR